MPAAARSVEASSSSPCTCSGEAVQQTTLTRGRLRRSPPVTSAMRTMASTCQRPSTSCCTCLRVWRKVTSPARSSCAARLGRSVAATIGHMMSVERDRVQHGRSHREVAASCSAPFAALHVEVSWAAPAVEEVRPRRRGRSRRPASGRRARRGASSAPARRARDRRACAPPPLDGQPSPRPPPATSSASHGPKRMPTRSSRPSASSTDQRPLGRRRPLHRARMLLPYQRAAASCGGDAIAECRFDARVRPAARILVGARAPWRHAPPPAPREVEVVRQVTGETRRSARPVRLRALAVADVHAERAARIEAAPRGGRPRWARRPRAPSSSPRSSGSGDGELPQQRDGVGVARGAEDLRRRALLDDAPEVHHGDVSAPWTRRRRGRGR